METVLPLQWHHIKCDGVTNHRRLDSLLKRLFRRGSKEISKLRVTGISEGNSPVTGKFPSVRANNAEMFPFDDVIMTMKMLQLMRLLDVYGNEGTYKMCECAWDYLALGLRPLKYKVTSPHYLDTLDFIYIRFERRSPFHYPLRCIMVILDL